MERKGGWGNCPAPKKEKEKKKKPDLILVSKTRARALVPPLTLYTKQHHPLPSAHKASFTPLPKGEC